MTTESLRGWAWTRRVLIGVVALGMAAPSVVAQTLSGRVVDGANSRPIADVVLRVTDVSGELLSTIVADSTGRYLSALPGPGRYRLAAQHLGYDAYRSDVIEARAETDTVRFEVRLAPTPIEITGVEVSTDRVNRRIRDALGTSPGQLRIRPIRTPTIRDHLIRGNGLSEMMRAQSIPNLQILPGRQGPCYQFRGRGCMPVYLDGARLSRASDSLLPLEMMSTVVVLLPNEVIRFPEGGVHIYTVGFMR